jgi:hypothetical protein
MIRNAASADPTVIFATKKEGSDFNQVKKEYFIRT